MKVIDVSFSFNEKCTTKEQLLQHHYTVTGITEALAMNGIDIIVLKRFSKEASFERNKLKYCFVKDKLKSNFRVWHLPLKFLRKISSFDADIIHVHGLVFPLQVFVLKLFIKKKTALILQHHGGIQNKGWKKLLYTLLNSVADAYFFTTFIQGKNWFAHTLPKQNLKVLPVMEGSNYLKYIDRKTARAATGINNKQIFLWVGRLNKNKDPLTVLDGFEILLQRHTGIELYMIYSSNDLLEAVKEKLNHSENLKQAVHLIGKVEYEKMEFYYNSADYFVLGSHYEGSGYALSEALACGCIPIVTNIASFAMMTNNGNLGALWECGNKHSFAEAATKAMNKSWTEESSNCVNFFQQHLSYKAIAETTIHHYQNLLTNRKK